MILHLCIAPWPWPGSGSSQFINPHHQTEMIHQIIQKILVRVKLVQYGPGVSQTACKNDEHVFEAPWTGEAAMGVFECTKSLGVE